MPFPELTCLQKVGRFFGNFHFARFWRRNFLQLVLGEIVAFCIVYVALSAIFHFLVTDEQRSNVDKFMRHKMSSTLEFVISLFLGRVVHRYLSDFSHLPWPDRFAFLLECYILDPPNDSAEGCKQNKENEKNGLTAKSVRLTLYRWYCVSMILALSRFSQPVFERFQKPKCLIRKYKLLTKEELEMLNNTVYNITPEVKMSSAYFAKPLTWCFCLLRRARDAGLIDDLVAKIYMENEIAKTAHSLDHLMTSFRTPQISLGSVQVVVIAVYFSLISISLQLGLKADLFSFFNLNPLTHDETKLPLVDNYNNDPISQASSLVEFEISVNDFPTAVIFRLFICKLN